jgi:hypothetical protein
MVFVGEKRTADAICTCSEVAWVDDKVAEMLGELYLGEDGLAVTELPGRQISTDKWPAAGKAVEKVGWCIFDV